ncbi:hypothetical protein L195_g004389 [Trifolium pratense]|uniref:Uncharacterized protein n=1 Tax=Trifolium pratense TaxID=57577 RepID=A0A2K3NXV9_TRIPR|nr:hypothetical protein L195_g004389 [Trifolium pratense]
MFIANLRRARARAHAHANTEASRCNGEKCRILPSDSSQHDYTSDQKTCKDVDDCFQ